MLMTNIKYVHTLIKASYIGCLFMMQLINKNYKKLNNIFNTRNLDIITITT